MNNISNIPISHYKVLSLPSTLEPNSVYYVLDQNTNIVKGYITSRYGIPIPIFTVSTEEVVNSVTGTAVTGTSSNPKVNIVNFLSSQLGNLISLSNVDGKLQVNPITSPEGSIEITNTATELQIELSAAITSEIQSALQPGSNISELTNDVGYITIADIEGTDLTYTATPIDGVVVSSTGNDAIISLATTVNAGLLEPSDKVKLNNTSNINSGDQISIIGISGTKAEFNTELTDGDFLFVGDITQYTDELAQDAVGGILTDTTTIDLSYNDGLNTISADVKPNSIDATHLGNSINVSEFVNTTLLPYTGAISNTDLGEYQLKAGQLEFDQTPTGTTGVAILRWNDNEGTLDLGLKGGNVTLQLGQEQIIRIVNKTGVNLLESAYQVIYISGAQGNRLKVDLALANSDLTSAGTIGLVTETINNNQEGFITSNGLVRGINTTGSLQGETWIDGDILYVSPIVAGRLTNIKPIAPQHSITIGICVSAHITQGSIFVKVDNGYELEELHNVLINTPVNNQILTYESATSLWKNKTVSDALGFTPVNPILNISTTSPLLGGGNLTANRTLSIQQATTSQSGFLSNTDWNTFNNKQNTLTNPITGTGTLRYIPMFNGSSSLTNSSISSDGQGGTYVTGYLGANNFGISGDFSISSILSNHTAEQILVLNPVGSKISKISYADLPTSNVTQSKLDLKADLASPTFTGVITTPELTISTNLPLVTTEPYSLLVRFGLTGEVRRISSGFYARTDSPTFTGVPNAPTATAGTNTTQIASTAFVQSNINDKAVLLTGNQTINGIKTFASDIRVNGIKVGLGGGGISSNTVLGNNAGAGNTTGTNNLFIGQDAGTYNNGGFGNTSSINSIFIGNNTGNGEGQINQIVIGYSAQGNGDNTTTIGNTSTNATYLRGIVETNGGFKITGGTSSQFLKADGSVDESDVVKNIVKNATQGANITGTVSETILYSKLIPANTFKDGDFMNLFSRVARPSPTASSGGLNQRVRINNSNTLTGATQIAINTLTAGVNGNQIGNLSRIITLYNGFMNIAPSSTSLANDYGNFNANFVKITFDPTVDNYIFITGQLGFSGDTMYHVGTKITN